VGGGGEEVLIEKKKWGVVTNRSGGSLGEGKEERIRIGIRGVL